jgi:hypothetical protein
MKNTRRCKICRKQFTPRFTMMQPTCMEPSCLAEYGRKEVHKQEKEKVNVMKEKQMDVPYFKKKLQSKVQAIARHLDFGRGCISCGKPPYGMVYGGHRWAKGDYTQIRFDLHNISSQCYSCNEKKSGNIDGYVKGLEERYSIEYKEYVNSLPSIYPETKLNLFEIKLAYAKAVKIEGELRRDLKLLEPSEVIARKNEINENLGYHLQKFEAYINKKQIPK